MLVLENFLLSHNSLQWSQVSRVVEFYTTNIFIQLHVVPGAPRNLTVTYDANFYLTLPFLLVYLSCIISPVS